MATQLDYYNTFLANKAGRRVKFDLIKTALTWFREKDRPVAADEARAQCVLDEFAMLIDERCGINTEVAEMQMIGYQAVVAAGQLEKGKEPEEDKDLHETS